MTFSMSSAGLNRQHDPLAKLSDAHGQPTSQKLLVHWQTLKWLSWL